MKKYLLFTFLLTTLSAHALIPELSMLELRLNQLADLLRLTEEPRRKPKRKPEKVKIPKIKIANIMALRVELSRLIAMPERTPQEKASKKAEAKGMVNGILAFVRSAKFRENQAGNIKDAVTQILEIDPLLISTAAIVLREARIPMSENYQVMIDYYERSVLSVEDMFSKLDITGMYAGFREDLDEALTYPMKLSGEIEAAQRVVDFNPGTPEAREAQNFIDAVNALRQRILKLLKKNKRKLEQEGIDVDLYINGLETKNRVFCGVIPPPPGKIYVPFDVDLQEIISDITKYQELAEQMSNFKKTFILQSIFNKMKGWVEYFSSASYCPVCVSRSLIKITRKYPTNPQRGVQEIINNLETIRNFLNEVYTQEKDEEARKVEENIVPALKEVIKRGWSVRTEYKEISLLHMGFICPFE